MGGTRYDPAKWAGYSRTTSAKPRHEIFTSSEMPDELNPLNIDRRESRDSDHNPESTGLIIGADYTGSMGKLAELIIKKSLGTVFEEVIARKPVSDPHLAVFGIGDVACDRAPMQATQFEADPVTLAAQLEKMWLEGNGGGNNTESYNLPWYFAALKTDLDCFEKRGKKGYLFTLGDEEAPEPLTKAGIKRGLGIDEQQDEISNLDLLAMVGRKYEVFHIIIEEGSHAQAYPDRVRKSWSELLGQRAISLSDYTKLGELIVSTIEINEGRNADEVMGSWDGGTNLVIRRSIGAMVAGAGGGDGGVVRL